VTSYPGVTVWVVEQAAKAAIRNITEEHEAQRLLPPQCRLELSGGRNRHSPAQRYRHGQHNVGLNYPRSESTFPQLRKILAGVPEDEQAKIAALNTARVYKFDDMRAIRISLLVGYARAFTWQ